MIFGQRLGTQAFANPIPPILTAAVAWREICPGTVDIVPESDENRPDVDQLWLQKRRSISGQIIVRCD